MTLRASRHRRGVPRRPGTQALSHRFAVRGITMKRSFLSLALLLMFATMAQAQLTGGTIAGTVTDEQGRTVPGATVDLRGTDITQTFTTGVDGQYRFLDLAPGAYK